ncbi:MAG: hypothetical protein JNK85_13410 [Verrucomicrobiales bacterium]|nr:hypothetical protein [Verrucomicrobiales bacterium]
MGASYSLKEIPGPPEQVGRLGEWLSPRRSATGSTGLDPTLHPIRKFFAKRRLVNYVSRVREVVGYRLVVRALMVLGLCGLSALDAERGKSGWLCRLKGAAGPIRQSLARPMEQRSSAPSGVRVTESLFSPACPSSLSFRTAPWHLDLAGTAGFDLPLPSSALRSSAGRRSEGSALQAVMVVGGPRAPPV